MENDEWSWKEWTMFVLVVIQTIIQIITFFSNKRRINSSKRRTRNKRRKQRKR